ncbi:hypothetical protein [Streptomyces malaysiensis]|uniref:hypothetical protein n=1 Tax=Streptomyces malaysiensis TaxID=92644 RepID=UPI0036836109
MKMMIEVTHCDACAKKGEEREATTALSVADESWDLCDEHGERFRSYLANLFATEASAAVSA